MSDLLKRLQINEQGRDFVIGDLHGNIDLFNKMMLELSFDRKIDRIVSVGDLIDRGLHSYECLQLTELDYFHAVKGNHELMFESYHDGKDPWNNFIRNGGSWYHTLNKVEQNHCNSMIGVLPFAIEVYTNDGVYGITHADCPYSDWNDVVPYLYDYNVQQNIVWCRHRIFSKYSYDVANVFKTIHGHTISNDFVQNMNSIWCDLGAYKNNVLGVVQVQPKLEFFKIRS